MSESDCGNTKSCHRGREIITEREGALGLDKGEKEKTIGSLVDEGMFSPAHKADVIFIENTTLCVITVKYTHTYIHIYIQ